MNPIKRFTEDSSSHNNLNKLMYSKKAIAPNFFKNIKEFQFSNMPDR